jgi:hypothetical protein
MGHGVSRRTVEDGRFQNVDAKRSLESQSQWRQRSDIVCIREQTPSVRSGILYQTPIIYLELLAPPIFETSRRSSYHCLYGDHFQALESRTTPINRTIDVL